MLAHAARRLALAPRPIAAIASSSTRRLATGTEPAPAMLDPAAIAKGFKVDAARMQLSKLREMESELIATVSATEKPIDWDAWKAEISYPGLVDELKAEYDAMPMPDAKAAMAEAEKQVDEMFDPIIAECEQIAEDAARESARIDEEMKDATYFAENIDNITVEEFLEKNPTFKKSVEEDIANNKWFVDEH